MKFIEIRSIFKKLFGRLRDQNRSVTQLRMLNGYTPVFTPWSGGAYDAQVAREAIDAIARHAGKLRAVRVRRVDGAIQPVKDNLERLLQLRPNPNMSSYDFLYKTVTSLYVDNNAFIYPQYEAGKITALWPVNCAMAEFVEDVGNNIYVRFHFSDGGKIVLPYDEVIHLRRFFYNSDLVGENNKPLLGSLNVISTVEQGLAQAVKSSLFLRGLIKYGTILKDEDVKANRDRFVSEYMTLDNSGGVAALDNKAEYQELNSSPKMVSAQQLKMLRDTVYRYFGINEGIVIGEYTENQWNAFYESVLEPIALQLSLEFTAKLFTAREQGLGNEIIFEANRLQYLSVRTKIALVESLMPKGVLSINQVLEMFNYAPIDGGDKRFQTLNFVDASKANQYQVGEEDEDNAADAGAVSEKE